jgi:hypothetical protein
MHMSRVRYSVSLLGLVAALGAGVLARAPFLSGESPAHDTPGRESSPEPGEPSLAEVRRATERFRDVRVALAEGYVADPMNICETAEMMGRPASLGAMGIHYFRPDLLGLTASSSPRVNGVGTHTDFRQPGILIYEPQRDGSLQLVAVENLVFAEAWRASSRDTRPSFHGVPYDSMRDDPETAADEAHMFEPHFDRHVWLYRDNPNGIFTPFNPAVTCVHHRGAQSHQAGHRADAH